MNHKSFHEYDNRVASRSHLSRILWVQGYPDRAVMLAQEGVEHALSLEYPPLLCYILVLAACPIAFWTGNMESARRYTRLLLEQMANLSSSYWQSWGHSYEAAMGLSADGGSDTFRQTVLSLRATASQPLYTDMLATIREELAGPEAIARAENGKTSWCAPEVLRAQAVCVLKQGGTGSADRAEAALLRSLTLAREQGARSWQLRTATSLARLYGGTSRAAQAYEVLAPVYGGFNEGLGTADLMAAAALLREL